MNMKDIVSKRYLYTLLNHREVFSKQYWVRDTKVDEKVKNFYIELTFIGDKSALAQVKLDHRIRAVANFITDQSGGREMTCALDHWFR